MQEEQSTVPPESLNVAATITTNSAGAWNARSVSDLLSTLRIGKVSERSEQTYDYDAQARLVSKTTPLVTFVVELTVSLNFTSEQANERSERR